MTRKYFLFLLNLISVYSFGQAMQDSIQLDLLKYMERKPMEKVYLHTDRPYYAAGDTLWFKAYLVNAIRHEPLTASDIVYVDFYKSGENKILARKILRMSNDGSSGAFILSDTLREGMYQIRAYTNWMLNFPDSFFFYKSIALYKSSQVQPGDNKLAKSNPEKVTLVKTIDFFPEGGNLIKGLPNRIGFKAVNENGKGIDFSGFILSDQGDTLTAVKSQHNGMGYFTIIPKANAYYLYIINSPGNKFLLPSALQEGYTITVDNFSKKTIKVFVKHNLSSADRAILIAHQRGRVIYAGQINSDNNEYAFLIPKDSVLTDGIVQLTLFNSAGQPQCERIVYVSKNKPLNVSIKTDKISYNPREKVTLEISVKDNEGHPVEGDFSLAVTDGLQVFKKPYTETIETYLLLSSEVHEIFDNQIRGTIEDPGYYFDSRNANAVVHMDMLLMTQGWRRFIWKDILNDSHTEPLNRFENGITITGQVLLPGGNISKKAVNIVLFYSGRFLQGETDSNGRFVFQDLDLNDSTSVMIQGTKSNGGKNLNVQFNKPSIPQIQHFNTPNDTTLFLQKQELALWLKHRMEQEQVVKSSAFNKAQLLHEVEVKATRIIEKDSRTMLYGTPTKIIKIDQNNCNTVTNILYLLQSRVAGVQVIGQGIDLSVLIRGKRAALLLDGIAFNDWNMISTYSPCDVEAIHVITHPTPLISGGSGGAISILTRRGNNNYDWRQEKAKGISVLKIPGVDVPRQFYSPVYENKNSENILPDLRATLFWQPHVKTNADGKSSITFYNSDEITTIHTDLEGITNSGRPVSSSIEYSVK